MWSSCQIRLSWLRSAWRAIVLTSYSLSCLHSFLYNRIIIPIFTLFLFAFVFFFPTVESLLRYSYYSYSRLNFVIFKSNHYSRVHVIHCTLNILIRNIVHSLLLLFSYSLFCCSSCFYKIGFIIFRICIFIIFFILIICHSGIVTVLSLILLLIFCFFVFQSFLPFQ